MREMEQGGKLKLVANWIRGLTQYFFFIFHPNPQDSHSSIILPPASLSPMPPIGLPQPPSSPLSSPPLLLSTGAWNASSSKRISAPAPRPSSDIFAHTFSPRLPLYEHPISFSSLTIHIFSTLPRVPSLRASRAPSLPPITTTPSPFSTKTSTSLLPSLSTRDDPFPMTSSLRRIGTSFPSRPQSHLSTLACWVLWIS